MQQIGGEHPVKSLGVLEHGQGISPSILNHVIVDYFFQSLDLELIIFCTSDLNKASSVHAFVCLCIPISATGSSEQSLWSSKFTRSIITTERLNSFRVASFLLLKYIYKKHLFLFQSSHYSFVASHTYICNRNASLVPWVLPYADKTILNSQARFHWLFALHFKGDLLINNPQHLYLQSASPLPR